MKTVYFALLIVAAGTQPLVAQQKVKSPSTQPVQPVVWKNNSDQTISLRWVNFEGNEQAPFEAIGPGQQFEGQTFPGHVFRIYVGAAKEGFLYMVPDGTDQPKLDILKPTKWGSELYTQGLTYKGSFYEGSFKSMNVGNQYPTGRGVLWKHEFTRLSSGKKGVEYLTELIRTKKSVLLRNPVAKTTVRIDAGGIDEAGNDNTKRGSFYVKTDSGNEWILNATGELLQYTF